MQAEMYSDGSSSSKRRKGTSDNSRGVLTVDSLAQRRQEVDLQQANSARENREK